MQEFDKLEAVADRLERDLAIAKSAGEIENLQAAYGYYIDKGLWDQAADLFTDDASYEYGQRGVYIGRARILEALTLFGPQGLRAGQLNNYMMLQPIIDVAPDNTTARARWRSDMQLLAAGEARWGEGTYENEYTNDGGVWKISKLHFYVTMLADYDKGWVAGNIPMDGPSAHLPPDRPPTEVYQSLPEVYLPPYHYKNPVAGAAPRAAEPDAGAAGGNEPNVAQRLRSLAQRVERLGDQAAVEKLQRAYGYYVDKAMWPDVADLFCETGTLEIGGRGVFLGRKRVLEYLGVGLGPVGPQHGQIINHQQLQGIVTVAPDGLTAKGRWTAFVMGGSPYAAVQWGDVTYENEYIKEDGVWKLAKLHAPFNMYSLYAQGWHKSTVPNTRPDSFPPPPDLPPTVVYLTFPSFYNEPFHFPNPVTGRVAPAPNRAAGGMAPMTDDDAGARSGRRS